MRIVDDRIVKMLQVIGRRELCERKHELDEAQGWESSMGDAKGDIEVLEAGLCALEKEQQERPK